MSRRLATRTAFQVAQIRFAEAFRDARNLTEREHDVLVEILTITIARLNAERLERELRGRP